ncbi:MAG: hypothetical protein HYW50_01025 [Candidatus Diapherotrites archaeon]|nr:hypothetical protein [Candidatus Diapherotrites archaeon]
MSSPAYCFSDAFDLPRSIVVGGEEFFYIIKISQQEVGVDTDEDGTSDTQVNIVIFSMIPRRDYLKFLEDIDPAERTVANQPPSVAASAFRTSSQVFLFSRPYSGQEYSVGSVLSEEIFVDPNTARVRYNSIEFRKEIRNGIESVYIYPCSSTEENCETVKNEVALAANLSGGFGC